MDGHGPAPCERHYTRMPGSAASISGMDQAIAVNDRPVTENDDAITLTAIAERLDGIERLANALDKKIDHLDVQAHELRQFIDGHRPALEAGLRKLAVLADPLASLRGKRHKEK